MREYLLFTLYGPMQSWGTAAAVGEKRPTAGQPTRSGVLGMVAGALGISRDNEAQLAALTSGYGVAVATLAAGKRFTDYHTVQVAGSANKRVYRTRRDEVGGILPEGDQLNTILSLREYLADAVFVVCLWARPNAPYLLARLREALLDPVFVPSLGRKACPLALPLDPALIEAPNAGAALEGYTPCRGLNDTQRRRLLGSSPKLLFMRADSGHNWPQETMQTSVRDMVTHHGRRQFGLRTEYIFTLRDGGGA